MVPLLTGEVAREAAALLLALVLFPVKPVRFTTLGVSTTKEERDLCFLFAGNVVTAFGASTFIFLIGNTLLLISSRLWSGLQTRKRSQLGSINS